jgi:hypothetical protein
MAPTECRRVYPALRQKEPDPPVVGIAQSLACPPASVRTAEILLLRSSGRDVSKKNSRGIRQEGREPMQRTSPFGG